MRTHASGTTPFHRFAAGVPLGMMLAAPASAANFAVAGDWPNYLLVASIAVLALAITVRAIEGRGGRRHPDLMSDSGETIDAYRNRVLKP